MTLLLEATNESGLILFFCCSPAVPSYSSASFSSCFLLKSFPPRYLNLWFNFYLLILQGDLGSTGEQGPQGSQGPQGRAGPKGEHGTDGASGDDVSTVDVNFN